MKPGCHCDCDTFGKCSSTGSRHLKIQFRKSVVESNRVLALLFDKIFDESDTNPRVDGFEKVRNLRSREFDIFRLENLCTGKKDKASVIPRTDQFVEQTSKAMFWSC